MNPALESFIGSFGILLVGFYTIPMFGRMLGVEMTAGQGAGMGAMFFIGRWIWLYVLRKFSVWLSKKDAP